MAEAKTKRTTASVSGFLAAIADPARRRDCAALVRMMSRVTGAKPAMWGPSIVGFGQYRYVYASGHTGDWPVSAFSPRKTDLVVYVMAGFERFPSLMKRLGKARTGKSCLYLKSLDAVDPAALEELVAASVAWVRARHPDPDAKQAPPAKRAAATRATGRKATVRKRPAP